MLDLNNYISPQTIIAPSEIATIIRLKEQVARLQEKIAPAFDTSNLDYLAEGDSDLANLADDVEVDLGDNATTISSSPIDDDLQADLLSLLDSMSVFRITDTDDDAVVAEQQDGEVTTLTEFVADVPNTLTLAG
jgi:hypothetical protein